MPLNTPHPEYTRFLPKWTRARDVLAGEDTLKSKGEAYLPRLRSQITDDYDDYKRRAAFFNATARTAEGFAGLIYRRDPAIRLPDDPHLRPAMAALKDDVDLSGTSITQYSKKLVDEILTVGRAGTLIDWEQKEQRSYLSFYRAEDILNWRVERIDGRNHLVFVVILEAMPDKNSDEFCPAFHRQIRVLRLQPGPGGDLSYAVDLWRETREDKHSDPQWKQISHVIPTRFGRPLPGIPFIFHGPHHALPSVSKPPLDDIIAVNLDHFRLNADYKHGVHFTALPTAWVSGFDVEGAANLKIGSSTAWVSKQVGATAGFLEFTGQGLTTFERAMAQDEKLMAFLGSRLLESQRKAAETAEALSIRQSGEHSVLMNIALSLSQSLSQALRWACWWHSPDQERPEDLPEDKIFCRLNTDYESNAMTAHELTALVQAWQAGAISRDSMLDLMRQGEVLDASRSNAEELRLIHADGNHVARSADSPVCRIADCQSARPNPLTETVSLKRHPEPKIRSLFHPMGEGRGEGSSI